MGPLGITRIADVTGLDHVGLPVMMVVRPNARSLSVSQGKGLSADAARASGLMEALELFHAERIRAPLKRLSAREMRAGHRIPEPDLLPVEPGGPFRETASLLWIEGLDLLSEEPVWVPYELVSMDCTRPLPPGSGAFLMSSNGLASGNARSEAVVHALCEVVERDALARVAAGDDGSDPPVVDLDTVDDDDSRSVLERFAAAGLEVTVWDVTSEVGVPCFKAAIVDAPGQVRRRARASFGAGCHPTRSIAFLRALTEAAQSRLTVIAGSRDDLHRSRYEEIENGDVVRRQRVRFGAGNISVDFPSVQTVYHDTFGGDLSFLLDRLSSVGTPEVVVVDLTVPGLGIPVVRVVVPGMRMVRADPRPAEVDA